MYTKAIETEQYLYSSALLKRAISYIDFKDYEKAMNDL